MADLFRGETCTESYQFVSAGTAHTFAFNFQPDKVVFNNLTAWTATAGKLPVSMWFRSQTGTAHASQMQVIDSSAVASFNFLNTSSNGFTVADTTAGPLTDTCTISAITAANPGVITHSAFTFQNNQYVRLTDLGLCGSVAHGMDQLNNKRFGVTVVSPTTCSLYDIQTGIPVDTSSFVAYVTGGRMCLETNVISLNNPQVLPYSSTSPYHPNPYQYDPVTYQLTAGTSVMGSASDVFLIEVYKWGQVTNLGQLT